MQRITVLLVLLQYFLHRWTFLSLPVIYLIWIFIHSTSLPAFLSTLCSNSVPRAPMMPHSHTCPEAISHPTLCCLHAHTHTHTLLCVRYKVCVRSQFGFSWQHIHIEKHCACVCLCVPWSQVGFSAGTAVSATHWAVHLQKHTHTKYAHTHIHAPIRSPFKQMKHTHT